MSKRFSEIVYSGFWSVLDWVYPPVCVGCGEPGFRLCPQCQAKIQFITQSSQITRKNRHVQPQNPQNLSQLSSHCSDFRHLAVYDGVIRDCIHALKYDNNQSLGELFSEWLAELVHQLKWEIDLVIPVPLSPQRVRERGYNQSALIAKPLALRLNRQYAPFGLKRIRNTPSQVGLSAQERRINVAGAFTAVPGVISGKQVLLVDDVMTTGSTVEACATALHAALARSIYCVTIAGFPLGKPGDREA